MDEDGKGQKKWIVTESPGEVPDIWGQNLEYGLFKRDAKVPSSFIYTLICTYKYVHSR
jgi:hypothetical protein